MQLNTDRRIAGVLVPVLALRGRDDLGIGDTAALIEFIDWAAKTGLELVEILPINESLGMHSPYSAISSRALDPLTVHITPDLVPDLPDEVYGTIPKGSGEEDSNRVDYHKVSELKIKLFRAAYASFQNTAPQQRQQEFLRFIAQEQDWLHDYTLFRVLMDRYGHAVPWRDWPEEERSAAQANAFLEIQPHGCRQAVEHERNFYAYVQWVAFEQWRQVKAHAARRGILLMGDIPFGISEQSCDVWANPELFVRGWWGGTPPDKFFTHDAFVQKWGQNWGIPIYDWDAMRLDGFRWWRQRVAGVREFFDLFRVDHILGFYRIYGFPWPPQRNQEFLELTKLEAAALTGGQQPHFLPRADNTEENCARNCADGEEYLKVVLAEAGEGRLIGEDLGEVPEYVRPSLLNLGIAGYKVPAWEQAGDGELVRGEEYPRLSLATYATHDHEPLKVMWQNLAAKARDGNFTARREMEKLAAFAGLAEVPEKFTPELHEKLVVALLESNPWLTVFTITDLLGREERFNLPGVADASWTQRLHLPVGELPGKLPFAVSR